MRTDDRNVGIIAYGDSHERVTTAEQFGALNSTGYFEKGIGLPLVQGFTAKQDES